MSTDAAIKSAEPKRRVPAKVLARQLGIHRATLYRMVANGQLPPPYKLGKASRWDVAEVEAALAELPRRLGPSVRDRVKTSPDEIMPDRQHD